MQRGGEKNMKWEGAKCPSSRQCKKKKKKKFIR